MNSKELYVLKDLGFNVKAGSKKQNILLKPFSDQTLMSNPDLQREWDSHARCSWMKSLQGQAI